MKKATKQITVITGLVIKDHKVLLTQRDEKECPGAHLKWELPGGKVDFRETPEQAIAREILEETGVIVKLKKLLPFTLTAYWDYDWGTQQVLLFVYLCDFVSQKKVKKDHHVKKIAWVEIEKVKNLDTLPGTHEAIKVFKQQIHPG